MESIRLTFKPTQKKRIKSIYIVEDTPSEMEMAKEFFSRYPTLNVKGYTTGEDCVKDIVISSNTPDLILLDYFLDSEKAASKDGLEILVKLRELCPYAEIIMHSAVDNDRVRELARTKGATYYVVKGADGYSKLDGIIETDFVMGS